MPTFVLFTVTAFAEIAECFAVWAWAREGASPVWLWAAEGARPARWDLGGGVVILIGAGLSLYGPRPG